MIKAIIKLSIEFLIVGVMFSACLLAGQPLAACASILMGILTIGNVFNR